MKKYESLMIAALLFLFSACVDDGEKNPLASAESRGGGIAFQLAKNTIPSEVGILEVRLEREGYTPITNTVWIENFIDTVRISMNDIPVGDWLLTIDAKDSSGHLRYTGSTSVAIIENQTVQAFVQMNNAGTGTGSVHITVTWQSSPRLGEEFDISFGQRISIQDTDLKLKFVNVLEDSRCPENARCIWAGNAKILIDVNGTGIQLNSYSQPRDSLYRKYRITLVSLSPRTRIGRQITPNEYAARLVVTEVDKIIMSDHPDLLSIYKDPLSVKDSITVNEEVLRLVVSYTGGCTKHDFILYGSTLFLKSNPPQAELFLSHNGRGDMCEALPTEELHFGISPLLEACRKQFGYGQILLRIYPPGSSQPVQPLVPVSF